MIQLHNHAVRWSNFRPKKSSILEATCKKQWNCIYEVLYPVNTPCLTETGVAILQWLVFCLKKVLATGWVDEIRNGKVRHLSWGYFWGMENNLFRCSRKKFCLRYWTEVNTTLVGCCLRQALSISMPRGSLRNKSCIYNLHITHSQFYCIIWIKWLRMWCTQLNCK